jgi:hypothetical protein
MMIKEQLELHLLSSKHRTSANPGYAMSWAVSLLPLTAEGKVQWQASLCRICGRQSVTGTFFCLSTSVFPYHCHITNAAYSYFIHVAYYIILAVDIIINPLAPELSAW